ncbi:MAG: non-ribosomal peptide synthetase [Candidatus Dormibacteraeota bacterium]|nr:non-ribosomal peptide synthetase [Candidatus Dormibacteraeota bacterium]
MPKIETGERRNSTQDVTIPELVGARAAETPDAIAVVAGNQRITYQELDTRANQLAHHLRALGVGPEVLVGLCLERSIELVVGALGILKAAGAYVPLDPGYPRERLVFMLQDARARVLVTEPRLAASLPRGAWHVVSLDSRATSLAPGEPHPPPGGAAPGNLAYVIYTSGSTGRPKGVQITHDALLNLVHWHQQAFTVTRSDRATLLASPAFDAAVWELWPYLTAGASVYVPDDRTRMDTRFLRDWLVRHEITICFLATPIAEAAMTLEWPAQTSLRVLLTGADTLHRYPPSTLPFAVVNNYGPTETTVVATSGWVPPANGGSPLPSIGRPIANTQGHVLDENLQPVPPGTAGELYVGGRGVARGYLNRPELTAERFISDPFTDMPGARLYRTGDLVRLRADGDLEFIGRIDQQVKIRGLRIELGEVEAVLGEHPEVQQAVVVAREDSPGERRLMAYFVPLPDSQPTVEALRNFLRTRLPDYMVPAAIIRLQALPLTTNGKVDRSALQALGAENAARDGAVGAPRTIIEERLAGIVAELLQLQQVGMEENFFLLGGHSLLGAQLLARVHEAFGVELTLRTLFDIPTISGLSAEIEQLVLRKLEAMTEGEAESLLLA